MIIDVKLRGQVLSVMQSSVVLAEGAVNTVQFRLDLDEEWEGMSIVATFRSVGELGDEISRDVLVSDHANAFAVPAETLRSGYLYMGCTGITDGGERILTTRTLASPMRVWTAEKVAAELAKALTPELSAQILAVLGDVSKLDTVSRDNLVAAINECYSKKTTQIIPVAAHTLNGFAYVASDERLPNVVPGSGGAHVGKGTQIIFIPDATNTVEEITLQINNGAVVPIRRRASAVTQVGEGVHAPLPIAAGALIRGVPYTMTFCGLCWLLDSYVPMDGGGVDATQLRDAVDAAIADSGLNLPVYSMVSNSGLSQTAKPTKSVELSIDGFPYDFPDYNGGFSTSQNARRSDYIEITEDMESIHAVAYMGTTGCLLSFYDADKTRIDNLDILGTEEKPQTVIVDLTDKAYTNAKYFVVAYFDAGKVYEYYECTITYKAQESVTDRGLNILIFGDSITTSANVTIDKNDCTSAYVRKTSSYVGADGKTVTYNNWPNLLSKFIDCKDVRNYAFGGASYKDEERSSGQELRNLSYQIRVALNDLDNPNGVFPSAHYDPDIVIFSLGTNDGEPNDSFESARSKAVLASDGFSIDADATLQAFDRTKFCEATMWAFLTIKQAFPMAMCFCVLPIQRAQGETNSGTLHDALKAVANRYGFVVVDGAYESGIIRDLEVRSNLGVMLHDGLHPNEKGQNLLARMILTAIRRYYLPFDGMN